MPTIHPRISEDNYRYLVALSTMNGISLSATANMLFAHCRKAKLGFGMTPAARSGAPEETPDDDN